MKKAISLTLFLAVLCAACATLQRGRPLRLSGAALSVGDLDASVRWYETNLGLTVLDRKAFPEYHVSIVMMRRDEFELELVRHDQSVPPPADIVRDNPARLRGINKLVLAVPDIRAAENTLRANGARFQMEPRDSADGTRALIVLDPDGNWIELTGRQ